MSEAGPRDVCFHDRGMQLARESRWREAYEQFYAATQLTPENAEYRNSAGVAAWMHRNLEAARSHLEIAVQVDPNNGDYAFHLGRVCEDQQDLSSALRWYVVASEQLDEAKLHFRLGAVLARLGCFTLSARALEAGLNRDPDQAREWHALAVNLCSARNIEAAEAAWQRAIAIQPEFHYAHSQRLLALHYHPDWTPAQIFEQHRRWGQQVESSVEAFLPLRSSSTGRLRMGYLSPDLRNHSVSYFLAPLLRHHNRAAVDVICYCDNRPDAKSSWLQSFVTEWYETGSLSCAECAGLIRSHELDVLVDLAGHTSPQNRLLTMAARPARLHINAIGYPDTSGLTRIDYRLTDAVCDPPGDSDDRHTERLLRLDPCFLCYAPPGDAPPVAVREDCAHTVFGCFNALPKLSQNTLSLFSAIMKRLPEARLLLKASELVDSVLQTALRAELLALGISPDQLEVRGPTSTYQEHLLSYGDVDVALDPFPYNGTTTTCEALWMGIPVITLQGTSHVSRVGASLLNACGLSKWIAHSESEYVELAVRAARDHRHRRDLRANLRGRLQRSPLLDGTRYTQQWEERLHAILAGNLHPLRSQEREMIE